MSLTKENIVVLKGQSNFVIRETGTTFEANKHYRCLNPSDNKGFVIFGEYITNELFNEMFEFLHDRMMRDFKEVGLMIGGRAISKTTFKEQMDIHQYGKGKSKLFKGFFGSKMMGMFSFDCVCQGDTKAQFITDSYNALKSIINGDMTPVDDGIVKRGNSGVPLTYGGDIHFKKQYTPENKDLNIYY